MKFAYLVEPPFHRKPDGTGTGCGRLATPSTPFSNASSAARSTATNARLGFDSAEIDLLPT